MRVLPSILQVATKQHKNKTASNYKNWIVVFHEFSIDDRHCKVQLHSKVKVSLKVSVPFLGGKVHCIWYAKLKGGCSPSAYALEALQSEIVVMS